MSFARYLSKLGILGSLVGSDGKVTQAALAANVAGNGPAFSAYANSNQTISSANTFNKMLFQAKEFDTNSCFNNTGSIATLNGLSVPAYSFMPNVAGYYLVTTQVSSQGPQNRLFCQIYKNGSGFKTGVDFAGAASGYQTMTTTLVYLNGTTDYIECYGYFGNAATLNVGSASQFFQAALIRAA